MVERRLLSPEEIEAAAEQLYQMRRQQLLIEEAVVRRLEAERASPAALEKKSRFEELLRHAGLSSDEAKDVVDTSENEAEGISLALEKLSDRGVSRK